MRAHLVHRMASSFLWSGCLGSLLLLLLLGSATTVAAQPMMMDPSKMSGIPRPDPQVPKGTITVRLIRGELSNRLVDHEVRLLGPSGEVAATGKTDAEGRATFSSLGTGPFVAQATDAGRDKRSSPIALPDDMGIRVMLVFPKEAPAPSGAGEARLDRTLAAGLLIVQAQSGDGNPLPEAEIIVGHAKKGDDKIEELRGTTDARGEARFEGLDTSTQSGYLVEVRGTGGRASSKPFALSTEAGARVLLMVGAAARTSDPSSLQVGPDSHFIVEVTDEAVQVIEVLRILNPSSESVDVPGGLKLPLPERAVQAQAAPGSPASLTVAGHEATLSGEIPPGETQVAIIFMMATSGGTLDIVQQTTLPFAAINVVHERKGELRIEGLGPSDSRDLQGRSVALYHGPGVARGGQLRFTLAGLPHADATWRLAGGGVAGLLLLALLGWSFGGRGVSLGPARRAELERERERLLEELVAYDRTGGTGGAARTKLVEELARVYQALDQA